MVKKTIEDTSCSFEVALTLAISAKNTLQSVHGYSPNQLVFGKNPNPPSFLNDKLPALEGVSTSEIVASNLRKTKTCTSSPNHTKMVMLFFFFKETCVTDGFVQGL